MTPARIDWALANISLPVPISPLPPAMTRLAVLREKCAELENNILTLRGELAADAGLLAQPTAGRPHLPDDVIVIEENPSAPQTVRKGPMIHPEATLDLGNRFFIRAFVAMQYFGYLRRDPDTIGYNNWVTTLTQDPSNFRHMIFGFIFSTEYRGRFGAQ